MTDVDRLANIERRWHVSGRDGFGDPPDVDYWTEDEMQAPLPETRAIGSMSTCSPSRRRPVARDRAMAGAKANGADARAMAKPREFVASLDQSGR
jgi:hypothetical protein